ncbi:hypothetical protein Ahy_A03g014696 isoform A [Arachis hypogaea]|uniref:FAR1 domain-containing protein n=1 Tax=Arachis hypogaea TaxID=3818 RepID=A0A445DYJ9_ARAHY|nr:hypothetical protein Ahy_A03g014696 isoform A [Arachis hypogaea]
MSLSLKDIGYSGFHQLASTGGHLIHVQSLARLIRPVLRLCGVGFRLGLGIQMATINLEDVLYTRSDDGVDYGDVASLSDDNILRKVLLTEENAYDFYQKFGRFHGFGICKGNMFKDGGENLIRQRFFCNRKGLRHRKHYNRVDRKMPHKLETMTNCEARMSNNIWRVKKVITKHNHVLTHHGMVQLIPNFQSMTEAAKA